jgi:hypothetical protein
MSLLLERFQCNSSFNYRPLPILWEIWVSTLSAPFQARNTQHNPHHCTNFSIDPGGKQKYDSQPFLLSDQWGWICAALVGEGWEDGALKWNLWKRGAVCIAGADVRLFQWLPVTREFLLLTCHQLILVREVMIIWTLYNPFILINHTVFCSHKSLRWTRLRISIYMALLLLNNSFELSIYILINGVEISVRHIQLTKPVNK